MHGILPSLLRPHFFIRWQNMTTLAADQARRTKLKAKFAERILEQSRGLFRSDKQAKGVIFCRCVFLMAGETAGTGFVTARDGGRIWGKDQTRSRLPPPPLTEALSALPSAAMMTTATVAGTQGRKVSFDLLPPPATPAVTSKLTFCATPAPSKWGGIGALASPPVATMQPIVPTPSKPLTMPRASHRSNGMSACPSRGAMTALH